MQGGDTDVFWQAAEASFRFRLRNGISRALLSSMTGIAPATLAALEDFAFARISRRLAAGIAAELISEASGLPECVRLRRIAAEEAAEGDLDARAAHILRFLEGNPGGASRSALLRKFRCIQRAGLEAIVRELLASGKIERVNNPPGRRPGEGRPPVIYRAVQATFAA